MQKTGKREEFRNDPMSFVLEVSAKINRAAFPARFPVSVIESSRMAERMKEQRNE